MKEDTTLITKDFDSTLKFAVENLFDDINKHVSSMYSERRQISPDAFAEMELFLCLSVVGDKESKLVATIKEYNEITDFFF